MSATPKFDLKTSEGGRGFIANLFVTVLRRHDFTAYIKERLAADFACALSQFIACGQAREFELQQRLTAADERADVLEGLLRDARQYHGVTLLTDPPQDAWKHHRISERIDAALKTAEGGGDDS